MIGSAWRCPPAPDRWAKPETLPNPVKPILLLQHLADDGPAHFATWMGRRGIPLDWRSTAAGDALPTDLREHAALAILGGAWSANDERPSLRQAEALVREAMASGRPVIGHCLGGYQVSRVS